MLLNDSAYDLEGITKTWWDGAHNLNVNIDLYIWVNYQNDNKYLARFKGGYADTKNIQRYNS